MSFKNNKIISDYYDITNVKEDTQEADIHLNYPEHALHPLTDKLNTEACLLNNFQTSIGERKKQKSRYYPRNESDSEVFTHNFNISSPNEDMIAYCHPCWVYGEDRIRKPGWIVEHSNCNNYNDNESPNYVPAVFLMFRLGLHPF